MGPLHVVLTAVHLLAAIAWLGGMIFHMAVVDPVFRKNEVDVRSAFLLALMERRFRKLVGSAIVLLFATGLTKAFLLLGGPAGWPGTTAGRFVLLKIGLALLMVLVFAVCPKTKSCSPIPGVCDVAAAAALGGGAAGPIRERSKVVLPRLAFALGTAALVAGIVLKG